VNPHGRSGAGTSAGNFKDFVPDFVMANGTPLNRRKDLDEPGYMFDDSTHVLRIRHDDARDIDVQGKDGNRPPLYLTFDDPHLAGGTFLEGEYPAGVIDWGTDVWRINVPEGKFGTFNLCLADNKASAAEFRFYSPRIFVGVDVYNGGASEATVTVSFPRDAGNFFLA
jgi:hypothetical protein